MISRIGFCCLFIGLITRNSQGTLYDAGDALILEVDGLNNEPDLDLTAEELTTSNPEDAERVSEDGSCTTNAGQRGTCMKSRDCFPYLFFNIQINPGDNYNDSYVYYAMNVLPLLKSTTESCSLQEGTTLPPGDVQPGDELVCCVTFARAIKENQTFPTWPHEKFVQPAETLPPSLDILTKSSGCGVSNAILTALIVGGREAQQGEFPWTVALFNGRNHVCGGSLIDSQTVLTAAHCVNNYRTAQLLAQTSYVIGDHNLYSNDVRHEVRKAKRLIFHKRFDDSHLRDDVALIILDQPVTFTNRIQPVCLNNGHFLYDGGQTQADVAGWGKLYDGGPLSQTLKTAHIRIWSNSECNNAYQGVGAPPVGPGMVCAGSSTFDSCQGDSGGPLTVNINGRGTQVGVVSWGAGCGKYPGVYTRVDKYINWINKYRIH